MTTPPRTKRPEIQALRAVAVLAVVAFHVAPVVLPGGFVGVDVFLVISGYLITSHLYRELETRGHIDLRQFYARRIRRLLPASMLVLVVVTLSVVAYLPRTLWPDIGRQIVASTLYVENWALAADATDYSASPTTGSPVQHFWSLSVEEQFYAVWPLALLAAAALARRARRSTSSTVWVVVAVLTLVSFVLSVVLTSPDRPQAYFLTPVRVWEFGIGALLALRLTDASVPVAVKPVLSFAGVGAIGATALLYSDSTPFPGWAALVPTLGAAAVIAAGDVDRRLSLHRLIVWRPVQYVGDISYSLYLWHWPLIVILPFALSTRLDNPMRVLVLVLSFALAAVTKPLVEDVFQRRRPLDRGPRASRWPVPHATGRGAARSTAPVFAATAAVMAVLVAGGAAVQRHAEDRISDAVAVYEAERTTAVTELGAASPVTVSSDVPAADLFPPPLAAARDGLSEDPRGVRCLEGGTFVRPTTCEFGTPGPDAGRVALVGDSHAAQWLPAVVAIAEREGWHLTTYLRAGCPFSYTYTTRAGLDDDACPRWLDAAVAELAAGDFDVVLTSAFSGHRYASADGEAGVAAGFARAWSDVAEGGTRIVAIRDTPVPEAGGVRDVPSCLDRNPTESASCASDRRNALLPDPQVAAAADVPGAEIVDLSPYLCTADVCPGAIGRATVYRDGNHLTRTFATTLAAPLHEAIRP